MADDKKKSDAKKAEAPKVDFDKIAQRLKKMEDQAHIKQIAPSVTDAYLSMARQHDKEKDLVTYKTQFNEAEAEQLGNKVYDALVYHAHRRYFNIDKDKMQSLLGVKDPYGNSYVDTIVKHHFNLERSQLTKSLKEMASSGEDISHKTLEKMLERNIGHHAQIITQQIVKDLSPQDMDKVKEYIIKLVDKHKLDPKIGKQAQKSYDFGDLLNQYISLAREYYQEEPKKEEKKR